MNYPYFKILSLTSHPTHWLPIYPFKNNYNTCPPNSSILCNISTSREPLPVSLPKFHPILTLYLKLFLTSYTVFICYTSESHLIHWRLIFHLSHGSYPWCGEVCYIELGFHMYDQVMYYSMCTIQIPILLYLLLNSHCWWTYSSTIHNKD